MSKRLSGRVAFITGAGDGIGAAITRSFAAEGAMLALSDIDGDALERTADALEVDREIVSTTVLDVTDKAGVVDLVAATQGRFGSLDILVNNAWGGGELSRVENKSDELLRHGLDVAYFGPFWAMQAAFAAMKERRWGRIVNLCSLNGTNAHIGTLEYNAAKEALRALTRTAAREWAPWGITANAICPGAKTAAFKKVAALHPEIETMADASNPMGRLGDPDLDIAPVAVFLASEDSRYVTGNTVFVDGGSHINGVPWAPELPN